LTEFWDRYTKLVIRNPSDETTKTITTDELDIVFQTRVYDDGDVDAIYGVPKASTAPSSVADIGIFNLSEDTLAAIRHENRSADESGNLTKSGGSEVTLISGYREHNGVIFTGVVAGMTQETSGTDILTVLVCRDGMRTVQNAVINKTFSDGILSDLVKNVANLADISIGRVDDINIKYKERTYTPYQTVDEIFKAIEAEATANGLVVRYNFKHGALYFTNIANEKRTIYDLSTATGLLSMQRSRNTMFVNDSYDVTTLLLPDINWMGGVKIGSNMYSVTTQPVYTSNDKTHIAEFTATIAGDPDQNG